MKRIIMLSATRISLTAYHDKEKYTANNEDHEYKLNNLVKKRYILYYILIFSLYLHNMKQEFAFCIRQK